jgi:hypothetical protein
MFQHQGAIIRERISNKGSYVQQVFQALFTLTSTTKVKSLKMWKLQITHQQVYVHNAVTTPHSDETPLLHNHRQFSSWPVHRYRVYIVSTLYTLTCNTSHASTGWDPFGSYIHTDVCVHNQGRKNGCDCATEEAHHCVELLLQQCVHILANVSSGVLTFWDLTFTMEVRANSSWNTCCTYKLMLLINSLMMAHWCLNKQELAFNMRHVL